MTDLDSEELLSNLSDSSFVILGKGSLPSQVNNDEVESKESDLSFLTKSQNPLFQLTNSSEKFQSKFFDGSLTSEEGIQKKLNELVKENYQLKETLSQNNLAIKSQLDTFFMWQQEVLKTHQSHKEKFLETKNLILKLRAENQALKKQLEESSVSIPCVSDNDIYAQVNKKPDDLEKLKQNIKEYEQKCNDLSVESNTISMNNEKLKDELKAAKNEIFKLNKELEDLKRDNEYLKQKSGDLNKNSLGSVPYKSLNSEAHIQICNMLKQLDEERAKVLHLKEELKEIQSRNTQISKEKLNTAEELNQCIDKLDDMTLSLDKQNQRFSSLQSWVSLAEENLKEKVSTAVECNFMSEINILKSHLNQEENVSRQKQESLQELRKEFSRLLSDYKALESKLNLINNKEADIEKYKEEISALTARVEAKDNELKLKQGECDDLKEVIKKLNLECEEVALLRIQMELYQSDFKEERDAREKLAGEKAGMEEQIRLLQRKINTLEQKHSKTPKLESSEDKNNYVCPNCMVLMPDFKSLEEHCNDCVNIDPYI